MRRALLWLLLLLAALAMGCRGDQERTISIVTTPEVSASGVVTTLAARFRDQTRVAVEVIVTDLSLIPEAVRANQVDVVFTNSVPLQQQLARANQLRLAQTIAYNDYLLVGPKSDPAKAGAARNAAEALRRIARRDRAFCSPVDVPDLRARESLLWEASPASPEDDRRYRLCQGQPLEVLREASRRGAYTLTDRASFEAAGKEVSLVPLLQGTPALQNDLRVLLVRTTAGRGEGEWFVQWLMSYRGREILERYRFEGHRRYFLRRSPE